METQNSDLELPLPCPQCGYLTGILSKIPPKNLPIDLLRSQYPQSLTESTYIQADISASEAAIQTLEAEILKLQAATRLVQSRLSDIQQYADCNRALISPWRRLPEELLVEIFTYVCEDGIKVLEELGEIWTLQQVSVRWRNLARNTPLLWSDIIIGNIDNEEKRRCKPTPSAVAARVQLCLELSKAVPLSVTSRLPACAIQDKVLRDAIKAIVRHSHRWEYAEFNYNSLNIINPETDTLNTMIKPDGLSRLQSLRIFGYTGNTGFNIFQGANALEDVVLFNGPFPGASEFPWANLTNLIVSSCTIGGTSAYDIESLFHALTKVEDLQWYWNDENFQPLASVVTLPALTRAYIEYSPHITTVLPMLRAPRLAEFGFIDSRTTAVLDTSPIVSILQTSEYGVKMLDVWTCLLSPGAILQVLREVPDVQILVMMISSGILSANEVLPKLIWCNRPAAGCHCEGSDLLPSLQVLKVEPFEKDHWTDLVDDFLVRMMDIMRSRSESRIIDTAQSEGVPSALALVESELHAPANKMDEYDILIKDLVTLGDELGIYVKFGLEET